MKVDMSPQAVKARLRTMDELWLLSVKLMNSKKVKSADTEIKGVAPLDEPTENGNGSAASVVYEAIPKGT